MVTSMHILEEMDIGPQMCHQIPSFGWVSQNVVDLAPKDTVATVHTSVLEVYMCSVLHALYVFAEPR